MTKPEDNEHVARKRLEAEKEEIGGLINRADVQLVNIVAQRMILALRIEEINCKQAR
jgi:hypothetical protein